MELKELVDYLNEVPYEKRISMRRRFLYVAFFIGFCALIITGALEIGRGKNIKKALELVGSEQYSLVCDGVKREFTLHEFVLLSADDFSSYEAFSFDDSTKTVSCSERGINRLVKTIFKFSAFWLMCTIGLLLYTEFLYRPQYSGDRDAKSTGE